MFVGLEDDEEEAEVLFGEFEGLGVAAFEEGEAGVGAVFFFEEADEAGGGVAGGLGATGAGAGGGGGGAEAREEGEEGVEDGEEAVADAPDDGEGEDEEGDQEGGTTGDGGGGRDDAGGGGDCAGGGGAGAGEGVGGRGEGGGGGASGRLRGEGFSYGVGGLAVEEFCDCNLGGGGCVSEVRLGEMRVCSTWTFHCERCSRGIASAGPWSVRAVNCSRASRWGGESWAISTGPDEPEDMAAGVGRGRGWWSWVSSLAGEGSSWSRECRGYAWAFAGEGAIWGGL